jgi:phospholipid/cholesterol/gamma-HCH transport system substrate-binding protein
LATLVNDAETADLLKSTIADLSRSAGDLAELSARLAEGRGLLQRLAEDEQLGAEVTGDLRDLLHNLSLLSARLERGEGTLGQLLNDPSVYEAVNDVIVGVNESALLRWLVRNRQKAGIEKRYEEQASEEERAAPPSE